MLQAPRAATTAGVVLAQYAAATAVFLLALGVRFAAQDLLPPVGFPFLSFFPAVLLVSFFTRLGPSLWCAALSTVAAWYFFIAPVYRFLPLAGTDAFALCFFVSILVIDCFVISIMKTTLQRLRQAEGELRLADRNKDEFLAYLAHELRNPLHVIRMTVRLLGHRPAEATSPDRVAVLDRQSRQMQRLVDDLLDAARISTGKVHVELEPLDLCRHVLETAQALRLLASERNQTLEIVVPDYALTVEGDASRLAQVIDNLVSNAAKFSPPGSAIQVRLEARDGDAVLSVIDQGRGLAADQCEHIFGQYVQVQD
ncbi:MAG: HAMP domain-containing histidine kinase, partial [Comamonadaceae bacterium]